MRRVTQVSEDESYPIEINDFIDLDYFLYYLSELEETAEDGVEDVEADDDEFEHDDVQEMLLSIGDGLGFDVEDEYHAAPGARIDVRWSTRVANLGKIAYAFEVHHKGSRDSAILNLQKAKNEDPTLQQLVLVSTPEQLSKLEDEIEAISSDFARSVSYLHSEKVIQASNLMDGLQDILQDAGLME